MGRKQSLLIRPLSLKGKRNHEKKRQAANEGNKTGKSTGEGALEWSCNQGLCAQEGPINPAVCHYISSGILKTAKNESPGPDGLLWAAESESNRQESFITPQSELQRTWTESKLFDTSDVIVNTQVRRCQLRGDGAKRTVPTPGKSGRLLGCLARDHVAPLSKLELSTTPVSSLLISSLLISPLLSLNGRSHR
ncbi:hypothetical protein NQZ68_019717 [Dissostichus eleginoides]|nr:hypothetical protein NQZ68_019717 [Dissostichus eleginoides]